MEPLVSVIVPVYKVEKYLDTCVQSIVCQTYRNLDILLVDDGSPDGCPAMCDAWAKKDERIRVIHKENAGLGMARNTGLENAAGSYVCFFDSDDFVAPDIIEKAVQQARRENAQIVLFRYADVNADGRLLQCFQPTKKTYTFSARSVTQELLSDILDGQRVHAKLTQVPLSVCCCLFDMELIRSTGWRFISERQYISEDSYSLIWLYQYVQCVSVLPDVGYFYRHCGTGSLTSSFRADRFEKIMLFYRDTIDMAKAAGYDRSVLRCIGNMTVGFVLGAMKQIAASDLTAKQKHENIASILQDGTLQTILHDRSAPSRSKARRIVTYAMRHKWTAVTQLLLTLQSRRQAKRL